MSEDANLDRLADLLKKAGIPALASRAERASGFPVPLAGGLALDFADPCYLGEMDPDEVGLVAVDPLGYPRAIWGLAERISFIRLGHSLLQTPIASLVEEGGALYLEGVRYFTGGLVPPRPQTFLLVVNAHDERKARRQASKGWRVANTLKKLGHALTSNQTTSRICVAAAHEIVSTTDLAAALIWIPDFQDPDTLKLVASVGVNRKGANAVATLSARRGAGCLAELVASGGQLFTLANIHDHFLTAQLEARFCYLKPKGLCVLPLLIAGRQIGVIELVGKEGDPYFEENIDLFETVAEHLALALSSAALYEQAERSALHDSLTGIPNHRAMQHFLHSRLLEAERTGGQLGAIMVDVDHFRNFNEEEGHDAGDEALKMVAQTLKEVARPYDLAARYGGEEFTILLPSTDAAGARALAERARESVEGLAYETASGSLRPLTISLGCAVYPQSARDGASLLKAADAALYEAKRKGRNRVEMFEGEFSAPVKTVVVDLEAVKARLSKPDGLAGRRLLEKLESDLEGLAAALSLSEPQIQILRALVYVTPGYRKALAAKDLKALETIRKAPEMRLLAPSLAAFEERFDGAGPKRLAGVKIPLLARALRVLLVLADKDGSAFEDEAGRFDPQIVALLPGLSDAA